MAVRHVLTWAKLSGSLVEIILGHFTSLSMVVREMLSIPSYLYRFVREAGRQWITVPGAAKRELRWMVALLPLAFAENTLKVSTTVTVSDA